MGEFAIKVSPFGGEYGGGALRGKDTSCGRGWCEPILVDLSPCSRAVVQAVSIIDRAIAKSCHDKKEGGCEPVLVADVTSTGN